MAHSLALALAPPFDVAETLARFGRYGVDAANRIEPGADGPELVRCVAAADGRPVAVRIAAAPDGALVRSAAPLDAVAVTTVRRLLGDEWQLDALTELAEREAVFRGLPRFRPPCFPEPFEALVTSVCAQQVSLFAATSIRTRLVLADGAPVDGAIAFPTPAALARRDPGELRTLGFSARKAEYVVGLARAVEDGSLELSALPGLDDDAVVAVLVALRGIGRWTAEWFLLRTLGRPDALPAGDLGVRKAVASADGLAILPEPAVRERAERWRPIRGLAALQLLHVLY